MLQNLLTDDGQRENIIFSLAAHNISLGQFLADVDCLTSKLSVKKGRRWALCYQNSYLFAVALFAVLCAKGQPVLLPNNQIGTIKLFRAEFDEILSDLPSVKQFMVETFNVMQASKLGASTCCDGEFGESIIFFTSGSTGKAKKIIRSLEQTMQEIEVLEHTFGNIVGNAAIYATVSHQHIYGLLFYILWPLYAGRKIHVPNLISVEGIEQIISHDDAAVTLISSPSFLMRMSEIQAVNKHVTIFSSGGKLTKTAIKGCNIIDILGSTETGGVAFKHHFEYNWQPLPKVSIRLDENQCLKVSSPFCSEDGCVMGDKAQINSDGSFQLLERVDRIVKVEGKRVSLIEVENILKQHELVKDAYTILMEDKRQSIAVVIVLSEFGKISVENRGKRFINLELKKLLENYFELVVLPRQFRYVDTIPVNSQGKCVAAEIANLFD